MTDPACEHLLYRLASGAGSDDDQRRAGMMILDLSARAARLETQARQLNRTCVALVVVVLINAAFSAYRLIEVLL